MIIQKKGIHFLHPFFQFIYSLNFVLTFHSIMTYTFRVTFNATIINAITWFFYEQIEDNTELPLHINVWGSKNRSSLYIMKSECVLSSSKEDAAHITFDGYGGMILSAV